MRGQDRHLRHEQPAERFIGLLGAVLSSGRAHVSHVKGLEPANSQSLGWREVAFDKDGTPVARGQGRQIGWVDKERLLLNPDTTYSELQELARTHHAPLELTQHTLWKRLDDAGLLAEKTPGRLTTRVSIAGGRKRVLCLPLKVLFEPESAVVLDFPKLSEAKKP